MSSQPPADKQDTARRVQRLHTDIVGRPKKGQKSFLARKFEVAPFSVLNAREGWWQDRKREWLQLGIQSELGRGENLLKFSDTVAFQVDSDGRKTVGRKADASPFHANGDKTPIFDQDTYRQELRGRQGLAQSYRMDQYIDQYRADDKTYRAIPGRGTSTQPEIYKDTQVYRKREREKYHAQPGGGPGKKSVWLGANSKPVGGDEAINSGRRGVAPAGSAPRYGNKLSQTWRIDPDGYDPEKFGKDGEIIEEGVKSGTSIFDPVLCEILYKWFVPKGGRILDPFAGGSVRGIVASMLQRHYVGIDLRPEQVLANEAQAQHLCQEEWEPTWLIGDSREIIDVVGRDIGEKFRADFLFSCPPYFDLELYSGDKRDLSNSSWQDFCADYERIILDAAFLLKKNRFACFVIGDVRDKKGFYRDLPGVTIECFRKAGLQLYNNCVLVTSVGSLPLRVTKQFTVSRKVGGTHQLVQVFIKGDPREAAAACPVVELVEGVNA